MKKAAPSAETHPHVFAWFCLCSKFSDAVKNSWTGAAAGGAKGKKGAAPKKDAKKAEDDLDDLFGDDDDDGEVSIAVQVLSTLYDTTIYIYLPPTLFQQTLKPRNYGWQTDMPCPSANFVLFKIKIIKYCQKFWF
jgi:hypothetical protein